MVECVFAWVAEVLLSAEAVEEASRPIGSGPNNFGGKDGTTDGRGVCRTGVGLTESNQGWGFATPQVSSIAWIFWLTARLKGLCCSLRLQVAEHCPFRAQDKQTGLPLS